jgi:hypothetical protein
MLNHCLSRSGVLLCRVRWFRIQVAVVVQASWNVMAHAQKPDFVFRRNGRIHLNRPGRQFNRLLGAEVCASAVVMLDTPCSEVVWRYWLPIPFASFPFTSPPVCRPVPSHFNWSLLRIILLSFGVVFCKIIKFRSSTCNEARILP